LIEARFVLSLFFVNACWCFPSTSSRSTLAALSARGLKKPLGGSERADAEDSEDGLSDLEDADYDDEVEEVV
jgi:hypothetical protein